MGAHSPSGDSPYGCADMAGNVLEWMSDWYKEEYYARSNVTLDPHGPASGVVKVLKGGAWSADAWGVRSAARVYANRKFSSSKVGFRCVVSATESAPDLPEPPD